MAALGEKLVKIVDLSMPFPASVIRAYSRIEMVFTSGDLSREAWIPRSTAKYYVRKMVDLHMISKIPHRRKYQKYQKYANARTFSAWLADIVRFAIRRLEEK